MAPNLVPSRLPPPSAHSLRRLALHAVLPPRPSRPGRTLLHDYPMLDGHFRQRRLALPQHPKLRRRTSHQAEEKPLSNAAAFRLRVWCPVAQNLPQVIETDWLR